MASEKVETEGKVVESLPNASFRVKLDDENSTVVLGYLCGKMRTRFVKVLPGDMVILELSPYDMDKGRIIFRGTIAERTKRMADKQKRKRR